MADIEAIRSYLVELGFAVNDPQLKKFQEALKHAASAVEKLAKAMVGEGGGAAAAAGGTTALIAGGLVAAGVAVVGVLAAIAAGTAALLKNVSQQDLAFQLYARTMFIGVDAAKKMKIAEEALGYSLEQIQWGPPELAERFHQLVKDQAFMMAQLGGPEFEKRMRNLRDIQQEFTRFGVAVQYFGMQLASSIVGKLFGSGTEADHQLDRFVRWFETNIPFFADQLSNVIVPVLQLLWWVLKNIAGTIKDIPSGMDKITGAYNAIVGGASLTKDQIIEHAKKIARDRHASPEEVAGILALIEQESGFNPKAPNSVSGAVGLMQIMPRDKQGRELYPGKDLSDPDTNMGVGIAMFLDSLHRHGGNAFEATRDYYGHGAPPPGQPTHDEYYLQWLERYKRYSRQGSLASPAPGAAALQPQGYAPGSVTVHVNKSNASPEDIKRAVRDGITEAQRKQAASNFAWRQGSYA
jgi:hypothetical protein